MRPSRIGWGLLLAALLGTLLYRWRPVDDPAMRLLAQIQAGMPGDELACAALRTQRPLLVLVMGQSNAGNHGEPFPAAAAVKPIRLWHDGRCYITGAPLPGGTGTGGSLWPQLEHELSGRAGPAWLQRPRVYAVIAAEGTRIDEWSDAGTPLNKYWRAQLRKLLDEGWRPDLLLWQQGEADAKAGTSAAAYVEAFLTFRTALHELGLGPVPLVAARSSYCEGADTAAVQQAWQELGRLPRGLLPGPDTDSLRGGNRLGPCHFSAEGLGRAASLWADALLALPLSAPQ